MKKALSLLALAALTIGLLGSCSKINERIDGLDNRVGNIENEKIASIENQIAAINASIADLGTIRKDITDLQVAVGAKGEDIAELKAADEALGKRIDELQTYVDTELAKYATTEWANATFATLEQLKTTNTELGALKETVGKLGETFDGKLADLKTELTNAINTAVSNLETRISTLEARVSALEQMIQSVNITPAYSDGTVEAVDGILTLKCIVSPAEALIGMESLKDSLLIYADSVKVKTKATTPAYMTIEVSEASVLDAAQGAITLTADISEYLPKGEDKALTVAVNIRNGISDFTTEFVPVTVAAAKPIVEYVEIGGVKWATKNLGAEKVTDYGYYFAWGGTVAYVYSDSDSQWKSVKDGSVLSGGFSQTNAPYYSSAYTKYTSSDSKTVLESGDDAATALLGSGWRMPTSAEFKALYDACLNGSYDTTTNPSGASASVGKGVYWCTSYDGVAGCLFCDGTNKLFFPAAGLGDGTDLNNAGSCGYFWSSSLNTGSTDYAYDLDFNSYSVYSPFNLSRHFGFSVRPVKAAAAPLPAGALKGEFSVSATKKVHFSQGNLWYGTVGDAQTATFNFEANQYSSASSWEASHVSHFYWSQSVNSAIAEEYDWNGSADDVFFTNATETTAKEGFTVNVNGKNQQGWRTLSTAEWQYLFNNHSKKWATVNGVGGYVIAPDNVTLQAEKTSYTATELNDANLVFLPAAGYRNGSYVLVVGDYGHYWTSTANGEDYAYFVSFSSPDVTPDDYAYRKFGCSVRLVTEVK